MLWLLSALAMCLVALLLSYFNSTPSNRMAAFHRRILFQRQRVRNRHYCTMVNEIGTCHRISQNSSWVSLLLVYWVIGYCTCICGILFLLFRLLTGSNSVTPIFITRFRSIDHCIVVVSGWRLLYYLPLKGDIDSTSEACLRPPRLCSLASPPLSHLHSSL